MKIVVFKNKYKEENRQPDYTIHNGEDGMDLKKIGALWVGKSSKGTSYMSGVLDDFNQAESEYKDAEKIKHEDEDIPF